MRSGLKRFLFPGLLALGLGLGAAVWILREPPPPPVVSARVSRKFVFPPSLASGTARAAANLLPAGRKPQSPDLLHPARLRNTSEPLARLVRDDHAILLRNALIDSSAPRGVDIPAPWQSAADPRAYIVQSAGKPDEAFRARIAGAGGAVVSYIPNNAYLVRMDAAAAAALSSAAGVQAVLPYEPYYKVDEQLLQLAAAGQPLPPETRIKLVFFADEAQQGIAQARQAGAVVVGEDSTPFGPAVVVAPPVDGWTGLAKLESVQLVERSVRARLANDLVRVALGEAANSQIGTTNYLGLTGTNVMVSLNDSGVDYLHPDLIYRVFTVSGAQTNFSDFVGHGTHVAGSIAGSGSMSSTVNSAGVPGSAANADYRGAAPGASIFILPIDLASGPFISNAYLQTNAAATNALLSNNSWSFPGVNVYDSAAASYDAAVRDALPQTPGMQPILYVFAAGNAGNGADDGTGGDPGSITSPGTAKNVITVGASDNFRDITNSVITTNAYGMPLTNAVYLGMTQDPTLIASFSGRGNVGIGSEGDFGRFKPDVVAPGTFVASTRSEQWVFGDNYPATSPTYPIDVVLDQVLSPWYRFDTGTSMAAPAVTGMLALMQEFFEQRLHLTNSPALYKALLINGARSLGPLYDFNAQTPANLQGWGLVNLTNSIPYPLATNPPSAWPVQFLDQSPTNALGTDQSLTWIVTLGTNNGAAAQNSDLKVTLVWTDPPANPAAGVMLVNDLDLVVTNLSTGDVLAGNNIAPGSLVTTVVGTNDIANGTNVVNDAVNNVENVFLSPVSAPLAGSYSVTVRARRVNVNAVTAHTNGVVQDFALVVASANPAAQITLAPAAPFYHVNPASFLTVASNAVPLLNQRVGASSPLIGVTNGVTNQWAFYVFNNTVTNGTNVAFATFFPPNLGIPRNQSADLDMYVSLNPALTNLDPAAVAGSVKSLSRNGTQSVIFTNEPAGRTYYIGIKAEDQQAGQFGFFATASATPFSSTDANGDIIITGTPVPQPVPDGNLTKPGRALVFGFATSPATVRRVTVTNLIYHELFGDLIDVLTLNGSEPVYLLNHNLSVASGLEQFVFDDMQTFDLGGPAVAQHSDGPGTLTAYAGQQAAGLWLFDIEDDVPVHTGIVNQVSIRVQPQKPAGSVITVVIPPGQTSYDFVNVPANATNLTVTVQSPEGPVEVFLGQGSLPSLTNFVKMATIFPNGALSLGLQDAPPLAPGIWFVGFYNPNTFTITVNYEITVGLEQTAAGSGLFEVTGPVPILDDAHTLSAQTVTNSSAIFSLNVAVRIDHPRVSDLVLRLTSPSGTTALLAENRGGAGGTNYGVGLGSNVVYTVFTEDTTLTTTPIKFGLAPFTNNPAVIGVVTNGPPAFLNGFENAKPGQKYPVGTVLDGWTVVSNTVSIFDSGLGFFGPSDTGTNLLNINGEQPGSVEASFATVPGRSYNISFAYTKSPQGQASLARLVLSGKAYGDLTNVTVFSAVPNNFSVLNWQHASYSFVADSAVTTIQLIGLNPGPDGMFFDSFAAFGTVAVLGGPYLPEEPTASLFQGQSAAGVWTLDVLDDRVGPANPAFPPQLLDWQLFFTFTPTNFPATALLDGLSVTNTVTGSNEVFFAVNVPGAATAATNTLVSVTGGGLNLWFNQSGLPGFNPDGTPSAGSFELLNGTVNGSAVLFTNGLPPQLEAGQEYYLGVMNSNPNGTNNTFVLTVTFDRQTYPEAIIPLTSGVPLTTNIAATNGLQYFVFNVSTNAQAVQFQATDPAGAVVLVASYGTLPIADVYDYTGTTAPPTILITGQSTPRPLQPGLWYLGVYNVGATPQSYTIEATEFDHYTGPLITLTNGVPYEGSVSGAGLAEFIVYAPPGALLGTNTLATLNGQGVELWFDQTNPPTGLSIGDFLLLGTTTADTFLMDPATSTPLLEPGVPYYLGVQNIDPTATSQFLLTVNFQTVPFAGFLPILTNGVSFFTNIPPGSGLKFFQYPTVATMCMIQPPPMEPVELCRPWPYDATFQVFGGGGGLQLYLSDGFFSPLPVPGDFTYAGTNWGGTNLVFLTGPSYPLGQSSPVALGDPSFWYLGVLNTSASTISFGIRVDELDEPPPWPPLVVSPSINPTNGEIDLTWVTQAPPPVGPSFYVYGRPSLVDPGWFNVTGFGGSQFPTNEQLVVGLQNTTYRLPATIPLQYFKVTTNLLAGADVLGPVPLWPPLAYTPLTNRVPVAGSITGTNFPFNGFPLQYYSFNVESNATSVHFNLTDSNGLIYLRARKGLLPGNLDFDYQAQAVGYPTQNIVIALDSQPVPLTPGPWYLGVIDTQPVNLVPTVPYTIEASESFPPTNTGPLIIEMGTGAGEPDLSILDNYGTNIVAPGFFYHFTVATNAAEVEFSFYSPTPPAVLLIRYGALPTPASYDSESINEGRVILLPGSTPALTNGDWYLGVFNYSTNNTPATNGTPLSYTLTGKTLFKSFAIKPGVTVTGNQFDLSWASVPGYTYYVEGKTNLSDPGWQYVSSALVASGTVTSYSIPTSLPFHYFRVIEIPPETAAAFVISPQLQVSPTQVTMRWGSIPGDFYYVQGKTNLTDPAWSPVAGPIDASTPESSFSAPVSDGFRFFRVVEYASPAAAPTFLINPAVSLTTNAFNLSWDSVPGDLYYVQGKAGLTDPGWQDVAGPLSAAGTSLGYAVPASSPYRFFRIEEVP